MKENAPSDTDPELPSNLRTTYMGAPLPAPHTILTTAAAGARVDFDRAMDIEAHGFVSLVTGQVAKNMIQASFFDPQTIKNGHSRPSDLATLPLVAIGIRGRGPLGTDLANQSAKSGIEVLLNPESPDDVDLIVECGPKEVGLAAAAFQGLKGLEDRTAVVRVGAGTNGADDLACLHFPRSAGREHLVEIVRGAATSRAAVARAFDYVLAIRRTPLVVHDSPGLFVSRLADAYTHEAVRMLTEGVARATVEEAGICAGYSVPPLRYAKLDTDSDDAGTRAGTPELTAPSRELIDRLLFIVALEAARCAAEGIVTSTAEVNVGSIMGVGYPVWTGGADRFVTGYEGGVTRFIARAVELATRYGERFAPPDFLA